MATVWIAVNVVIVVVAFGAGWVLGQAAGYDSGREDGASGRFGP